VRPTRPCLRPWTQLPPGPLVGLRPWLRFGGGLLAGSGLWLPATPGSQGERQALEINESRMIHHHGAEDVEKADQLHRLAATPGLVSSASCRWEAWGKSRPFDWSPRYRRPQLWRLTRPSAMLIQHHAEHRRDNADAGWCPKAGGRGPRQPPSKGWPSRFFRDQSDIGPQAVGSRRIEVEMPSTCRETQHRQGTQNQSCAVTNE